jgi:hypothetical protein
MLDTTLPARLTRSLGVYFVFADSAGRSTLTLGIVAFVMNIAGKTIAVADHAQTDAREREIQFIIDIVERNPEYQARL